MIILVDQDVVVTNISLGYEQVLKEKYPEIQIIPYEQRKNFYFADNFPEKQKEIIRKIERSPGFFLNLPIMPYAKESLEEMIQMGHKVSICTRPFFKNTSSPSDKYLWVEKNLGEEWKWKLIITKDKTMIRGDILIDDKPEIEGHYTPTWEHVIYDHPYNRHVKGRRLTWSNWREVLSEL